MLDFSSGDGDGFIEVRALDIDRANDSAWWSKHEPIIFDFRCSIIASKPQEAWLRANDFLQQMLDRITFWAGSPLSLISIDFLYNESELEACKKNILTSYSWQTNGISTRRTTPFLNPHLIPTLRPTERAKKSLRWFRKSMTFERPEDQFLGYFISLECISNDVKESAKITPKCKQCDAELESFQSNVEGIKHVISLHKDLPKDLFNRLRKMRSSIAHGSNIDTLNQEIGILLPILQKLAAEAIVLSLKADPNTVRISNTLANDMLVFGNTPYSADQNPHMKWGCSIEVARTKYQQKRPDENAYQATK